MKTDRRLIAPTGAEIIGTLERIPGVALLQSAPTELNKEPDYSGTTDMNWDGQQTEELNGEILWIDENGQCWPTSLLIPDRRKACTNR